MKSTLLLASLISFSIIAVGCKPAADKPVDPAAGSTAEQLDKAKTATQEATRDMKDFAFAQKTEFAASMKAKLSDLNRELDEISARVAASSAKVQADAKPKLAALRAQAAQLQKDLEAVDGATASTWESVKANVQKTYASLQEGFTQSRQWLSDKIAP